VFGILPYREFFMKPNLFSYVLLTRSNGARPTGQAANHQEADMDAKWNKVIDNFVVRTGMLVLGFGVWLAITYGVLAA
jgi:hypothetical protein